MVTRIKTDDDVRSFEEQLLSDYLSARPAPVLRQTLRDLETLHANYFGAETGPGGQQWPDLSAATIARKGHDQILVDSGKLKAALTQPGAPGAIREVYDEGGNAGLAFGLDAQEIFYSLFHEVPNSRLPHRPHIGMSEAELNVVAMRLLDHQVGEMSNAS